MHGILPRQVAPQMALPTPGCSCACVQQVRLCHQQHQQKRTASHPRCSHDPSCWAAYWQARCRVQRGQVPCAVLASHYLVIIIIMASVVAPLVAPPAQACARTWLCEPHHHCSSLILCNCVYQEIVNSSQWHGRLQADAAEKRTPAGSSPPASQ